MMKTSENERKPVFSVTLADCEVQTFRAGGSGGQNQNKRDTGVRIIHHPSGARGEARDERSQLQNKKLAFRRMAEHPLFRAWVARQSHEYKLMEQRVAQWVEREMDNPAALRLETRHNGRWVRVDDVEERHDVE
jgi:protein subunit release factor B